MSLSAFRLPPRTAPARALDGSPAVIMSGSHGVSLRKRSLRSPGALVIDAAQQRIARDGIVVEVTRLTLAFVVALAARPGAIIATSELTDLVYGHDPDGGPESASQCLSTLAWRATPALAALGFRVELEPSRGRWLRCCLSPLNPQEPHHGPC